MEDVNEKETVDYGEAVLNAGHEVQVQAMVDLNELNID